MCWSPKRNYQSRSGSCTALPATLRPLSDMRTGLPPMRTALPPMCALPSGMCYVLPTKRIARRRNSTAIPTTRGDALTMRAATTSMRAPRASMLSTFSHTSAPHAGKLSRLTIISHGPTTMLITLPLTARPPPIIAIHPSTMRSPRSMTARFPSATALDAYGGRFHSPRPSPFAEGMS